MTVLVQAVLEMSKSILAHLLKDINQQKVARFYIAAKIFTQQIEKPHVCMPGKTYGLPDCAKDSIRCANAFMEEWNKQEE